MFMLKSTHERILAERLLQNNTDHMNLRNQMLAEYREDALKWRRAQERRNAARKAKKVAK